MADSHTEMPGPISEESIVRQLLTDHFDGVLLIQLSTESILPVSRFLMGSLAGFVDESNFSYARSLELLLSACIHTPGFEALNERIAMATVKRQLAQRDIYTVDVQAMLREGRRHIFKRFTYKRLKERPEYVVFVCEDTTSILSSGVDPLTGIMDSSAFHKRVKAWIEAHPDRKFRIQRYNIDRFRDINGLYGYDTGNRLLWDFGQYMMKNDTADCFSAHLNADHFVRFCPEGSPSPEFYHEAFAKAFRHYHLVLPGTFHMGIYDLCEPDCSTFTMSYKALLALQSLKGKYDQSIAYYQKGMMDAEVTQQALLACLSKALKDDEFEVWLQPQVNYRTKEILGAEALTRWRHADKGLLAPGSFLPILEQSGRIAELDKYMITKICRLMRKWMDMLPGRRISVAANLSREYLNHPGFAGRLKYVVESIGVPIANVRFEITESALMDNPESLISVVEALHGVGCVIEMDDFGSAYSSLNTLKDIETDGLKLDMKFLAGNSQSARSRIIISSVIEMAKRLGIKVIAEGVETKEQADMLLSFGCEMMQGYYFSKPLPVAEYESLLKNEITLPALRQPSPAGAE